MCAVSKKRQLLHRGGEGPGVREAKEFHVAAHQNLNLKVVAHAVIAVVNWPSVDAAVALVLPVVAVGDLHYVLDVLVRQRGGCSSQCRTASA